MDRTRCASGDLDAHRRRPDRAQRSLNLVQIRSHSSPVLWHWPPRWPRPSVASGRGAAGRIESEERLRAVEKNGFDAGGLDPGGRDRAPLLVEAGARIPQLIDPLEPFDTVEIYGERLAVEVARAPRVAG